MKLNHTPALEDAIIKATNAKDGRGLHVHLCNLHEPKAVAERIREMAEWFNTPGTFIGGLQAADAAAKNIQLLAAVLREHLYAGNYEV